MADGVTLNAGSGGDTVAADDISSAKYQRVKLIHGIDGTNDGDTALTNPFPVAAVLRPAKVSDGTTTLADVKFAVIDVASAGDNTIVAAVASKKITVLGFHLTTSGGANTYRWESGASGTALTGQMTLADDTQATVGFAGVPLFQTAVNTLLNLELSGATSVDGWVTYCELP